MTKRLLEKKNKQLSIMVTTAMYAARYGFDMHVAGHDSFSRFSRKLLRRRYLSGRISKWFRRHNVKVNF